jgi:hypothetical protein
VLRDEHMAPAIAPDGGGQKFDILKVAPNSSESNSCDPRGVRDEHMAPAIAPDGGGQQFGVLQVAPCNLSNS